MSGQGEFDIIAELFAPLSERAPGAFSLTDDVAMLQGGPFAVTKDMMIEGVHFRSKDSLDLVARKLIRVNVSDLVAKGVRPLGYFLACAWPSQIELHHIKDFVKGLAQDQEIFKCSLYGGDTTRHRLKSSPFTLSATFFGEVPTDGLLKRSGAGKGDDIYVTGTIGDSGLGLKVLDGKLKLSKESDEFLSKRYWLPEPRLIFASALKSFATASLDISDGLLADANHLACASGVQGLLDLTTLPFSAAAKGFLETAKDPMSGVKFLATCGDDYEILFTAPAAMRRSVEMAAKASRTQVTRIGKTRSGHGIVTIDENGTEEQIPQAGFDHFKD